MPARRVGWVGRAGARLVEGPDGTWECPRTGERYAEAPGGDGTAVLTETS